MLVGNDFGEAFICNSKLGIESHFCSFFTFFQNHAVARKPQLKQQQNDNFLYCKFLFLYFKFEISSSSKSPNQLCELEISLLKNVIPKRIYAFIQY